MNNDERACPRCAETIKAAAKVCRFCGSELAAGPQSRLSRIGALRGAAETDEAPEKKKSGWVSGCLVVVGFFVLLGMCAPKEPAPKDGTQAIAGDSGAVEEAPKSPWAYSQEIDQVRQKTVFYAENVSTNSVDFEFPYAGGSTLKLTVRKHPQWGEDVILQISDGQFVCGIYDCKGTINFGSGPESITLNTPEDHDSKTLFIRGAAKTIEKVKRSETVVVELPFYQEGNRQFTFSTSGLEWPPKTTPAKN